MIEVRNLTKSYGPVKALQDVSFEIAAGEIVGLLGPNGAGKTTIIKTLTGYLQADEGHVTIDGLDILTETEAAQALIGYLPENAPLYPELSVQAYLQMAANLRKIPNGEQIKHISEAIYATNLEAYMTRPIGQLSKGLRQRVGLAQAILHRPRFLILDEPTVGLDPTQIVDIRHLIQRLSEHSTILFSTHILPEVEALCDRAIIIMNGQIKANAQLSELADSNNAILILSDKVSGATDALRKLKGVQSVTELIPGEHNFSQNGYPAYRIAGDKQVDLCPAIYNVASKHSWPLRELRSDQRTLETVFNELAVAA